MARYVTLLNYTQGAMTAIKGTIDRPEANRKGFEAMGVKLVDFYREDIVGKLP